jgi:hypothetical protein
VLALYRDDATLDTLFTTDRARYQTALTGAKLATFTTGSAHALDDAYQSFLTSKDVAGVLGLREAQLLEQLNASPGLYPSDVLALRTPGRTIQRAVFDSEVAQVVDGLGLGTPRRP